MTNKRRKTKLDKKKSLKSILKICMIQLLKFNKMSRVFLTTKDKVNIRKEK